MQAKDFKTGSVLVYNESPIIIEKISVQSPSARGGSTIYKLRARNLLTKQKVDLALKGTESLREADFEKRNVKLMYADATQLHFIDQQDFQQYSLPINECEEERKYLTEELEGAIAMIYNDACVGIQLPSAVELQVIRCDPGIKGNSATSRTKPAILSTGLEIQVPEYLKEGERVKVDTRDGTFLSRA